MQNEWLERTLERNLRPVAAPDELWDRILNARTVPVKQPKPTARTLTPLACAASLLIALWWIYPGRLEIRSDKGAEIRAWVKSNSGVDVPLRSEPAAPLRMIGARATQDRVEIAYEVGNRPGTLVVSRGRTGGRHQAPGTGRVFSWNMDGQLYTLACAAPEDLQVACLLCHSAGTAPIG